MAAIEYVESTRILNQDDRCDRCGAQAFAIATIGKTELFFCGHHFTEHRAALYAVAGTIVDETYRINEGRERDACE